MAASSKRSTTVTRISRKPRSNGGARNWSRASHVTWRSLTSETIELKKTRLKEKLTKLKSEMAKLEAIEKQVLAAPDQQISLTDPDSRSMATSGRGSGVVGYNVQTAVDT